MLSRDILYCRVVSVALLKMSSFLQELASLKADESLESLSSRLEVLRDELTLGTS